METRRFSWWKFAIIFIELILLTLLNTFFYFREENNSSECRYDRMYDSYPSYIGTVEEIEKKKLDIVYYIDPDLDPDDFVPGYEPADSVYIGIESIDAARIRVDDRWFYLDNSTYISDPIADLVGCTQIRKGEKVNFAYGNKEGVAGSDYVYAVKAVKDSGDSLDIYTVGILIPSIVLLISTACFLIFRATGVKITAGITTAISGIVILYAIIAILNQPEPAPKVRAHAPVIYLYDEEERDVNVKLDLDGELTTTYPLYDDEKGWNVTSSPDGILTNSDGERYRFLFWEADLEFEPNLSQGYCISGNDTEEFIDDALVKLGLNGTEITDFKAYWLPMIKDNPYNVITFQTTNFDEAARLLVEPKPDTIIRVNMLWYPSEEYVAIEPQDIDGINPSIEERDGFILVEWGGEKIDGD